MVSHNILVVCENHRQFTYFQSSWQRSEHRLHSPPDRLFYFERDTSSGRSIDIIIRTGTWYDRNQVGRELNYLCSAFPNAEWSLDGGPLYIFAENALDQEQACRYLHLDATDFIPILFDSPEAMCPEDLCNLIPEACYFITINYQQADRRDPFSERFRTIRRDIPIRDDAGPTLWVNRPSERVTQPIGWASNYDAFGQTAIEGCLYRFVPKLGGRSSFRGWPFWLSNQERDFLDAQSGTLHIKQTCCQVLEEDQMFDYSWVDFAGREDSLYLACWLMWKYKVNIVLAKHWAKAYCNLYALCGEYHEA